MRIAFFGTPEFAVPSLKSILESPHQVVAVVTQPDRPKGRITRPVPPPVKELARGEGLQVLQPTVLTDPDFLQALGSQGSHLAVVVAYGRILPQVLLSLFPKGAINLHASLLPKYRGAAPIQWALMNGEKETGVTLFQIDRLLDHGPILLQAKHPIGPREDALTLSQALSELGAKILMEALGRMGSGPFGGVPQLDAEASEAPRLTKKDAFLDWTRDCDELDRRIRGLFPWPGAVTWLSGKRLKILQAHPDHRRHEPARFKPGTLALASPKEGLWIQTGKGQIRIDRLQLEGGKELEAAFFLRGHPVAAGTVLTQSV